MLGFMDPELRIDFRDTEAQFAEVERRMGDDGWVRPQSRTCGKHRISTSTKCRRSRWIAGHWAGWRWSATPHIAAHRCRVRGPVSLCWVRTSWPASSQAAGNDYELGFANYHRELKDYVKRNQWLVVDNIPGGAPIPQEVFDRIVGSITLKDY